MTKRKVNQTSNEVTFTPQQLEWIKNKMYEVGYQYGVQSAQIRIDLIQELMPDHSVLWITSRLLEKLPDDFEGWNIKGLREDVKACLAQWEKVLELKHDKP